MLEKRFIVSQGQIAEGLILGKRRLNIVTQCETPPVVTKKVPRKSAYKSIIYTFFVINRHDLLAFDQIHIVYL